MTTTGAATKTTDVEWKLQQEYLKQESTKVIVHDEKKWIKFEKRLKKALSTVRGAESTRVYIPSYMRQSHRDRAKSQLERAGWYVSEWNPVSKPYFYLYYNGDKVSDNQKEKHRYHRGTRHQKVQQVIPPSNDQDILDAAFLQKRAAELMLDLVKEWSLFQSRLRAAVESVCDRDGNARVVISGRMSIAQRNQAEKQLRSNGWNVGNGYDYDWRGRSCLVISFRRD